MILSWIMTFQEHYNLILLTAISFESGTGILFFTSCSILFFMFLLPRICFIQTWICILNFPLKMSRLITKTVFLLFHSQYHPHNFRITLAVHTKQTKNELFVVFIFFPLSYLWNNGVIYKSICWCLTNSLHKKKKLWR